MKAVEIVMHVAIKFVEVISSVPHIERTKAKHWKLQVAIDCLKEHF